MAAKDEMFRMSAFTLKESGKNRKIIKCTLASDIALGGGIPLGCTVLLGGPEKMGKTTFALQCGAYAQNNFGSKIFYFPIEGRLTHKVLEQIRGLKLDIEHFEIVLPPPIIDPEDKKTIIGYKKWPAENWWEEIGKTIAEHPGSIIIVDSIANFSTEKEISEGMGFQGRGDKNKLEAQFCRRFGDMIIPNQITLFLMTQIQANTSGYGAPTQMKVGNQIKFQADIIMLGKKAEKWDPANDRILGQNCIYMITESALGPPHVEAKIPLRYGYGIDNLQDIVTQGINWNIIQKAGSWYSLPFVENEDGTVEFKELSDDKTIKYVKTQGENAIRNWFLLHSKEAELIESLVTKQVFG